jgi:hypothetical protein
MKPKSEIEQEFLNYLYEEHSYEYNLEMEEDLFYNYLVRVLSKHVKCYPQYTDKYLKKLQRWTRKALKLLRSNVTNSLIKCTILSLLANPTSNDNITDYDVSSQLAKEEIHAIPIPNNTCQELKRLIKIKLLNDPYIEAFRKIDDCFEVEVSPIELVQEHMESILRDVLDGGKLFAVPELYDQGETTYDLTVYINKTHYDKYLEVDNQDDNTKMNTPLFRTLFHELAHCKRIKYSSNGNFMRATPEKLKEAGDWLEGELAKVDPIFAEDKYRVINDDDDDIILRTPRKAYTYLKGKGCGTFRKRLNINEENDKNKADY